VSPLAAFVVAVSCSFLALGSTAHAVAVSADSGLSETGDTTVGIAVEAPGTATGGHGGTGGSRPIVQYDITWSVDPQAAEIGSAAGLCSVPGGVGVGAFGFEYHFIGRDAAGNIVDDTFVCVAFADGTGTRPPVPATPAVPTVAEAWNSVQLPAPTVALDPENRGITGLETRISTTGPTNVVIAATIRGYRITGTATLDHYAISVDGGAEIDAPNGRYTFEKKGKHAVAVSAVWHGVAAVTGPAPLAPIDNVDIGTATITSTRTYPVNEIRSVLQR
jgi:hypothetical protein